MYIITVFSAIYNLELHNALNFYYVFHCLSIKVKWAIFHIVEHK